MPKHQTIAYSTLRVSLGLVFILTGFLILQDITPWVNLVKPWVREISPVSVETALYMTALYDIAQGIWLISGMYMRIASIVAALHILQVLVVTGINWVTYRDIGILGMSLALTIENFSHKRKDENQQTNERIQ